MKHKAVTQRILAWMLALALLFTGILPANTASLTVNAASTTKSSNEITTAEEFPTQIPAGETYTLTADIKLADHRSCRNSGRTGTCDHPFRESTGGKRIRYDPEPGSCRIC